MIVVPNAAEIFWLEQLRGGTPAWNGGTQAHLFKTDLTLDADTVRADLVAAEADFSGYVAKDMFWPSSPTTVNGIAKMTSSVVIWNHNGGGVANTIYGYWVERKFDPTGFWFAEKLATPVVMDDAADELALGVVIGLREMT